MDSEDWSRFNRFRKNKKERRFQRAEKSDDGGWTKHTKYHWSRKIGRHRLDYWPSTGRWRFKDRTRYNVNDMFKVIDDPSS